jgi:hypothetical protein
MPKASTETAGESTAVEFSPTQSLMRTPAVVTQNMEVE